MSESQDKKLIKFHYGALEDSLEKQANNQGYTLGEQANRLENHRIEINDLWINNLLTDSEKDRAIEKLHKQVFKSIEIL